jgi:hypothetical protein
MFRSSKSGELLFFLWLVDMEIAIDFEAVKLR